MLEITRVDIVDGQTLDIELNNGHLILFDTQYLPTINSRYNSLRNMEVLARPNTDGQNIFWLDGTKINLEDILHWISMQKSKD